MAKYHIELYITGSNKSSSEAISMIESICKEELGGDCEIEIIDIEKDPDRAESEAIMAIPTLIKRKPLPELRLIGALSVRTRVLAGLDI